MNVTAVPDTCGDAGNADTAVEVAGGLITYVIAEADDGVNAVESVGVNAAEIWWLPTLRVLVLSVALPADTACAVPRLFAPSLNCTEPAAFDGVNVAVNVTDVPDACGDAGNADTTIEVDVAGGLIT
jgi:hypothetical protein